MGQRCNKVARITHGETITMVDVFCALPFRHAFEAIDGMTSGPDSFRGSVGKIIQENLTSMQLINFSPANGNIQDISKSLSMIRNIFMKSVMQFNQV